MGVDQSNATTVSTTSTASVSLPSSRRQSRAPSPASSSGGSGGIRSRRNSMDLYSANVHIKLNGQRKSSVETLSDCHIRCDNQTINDLKLCGRCHNPDHVTNSCEEYGQLLCPRCLEWDHWSDHCPFNAPDSQVSCGKCGQLGHCQKIHDVSNFSQRRAIVDNIGWPPFQEWFYESEFRSWWQLNGCVGVPLYKIYKRNTAWSLELGPLDNLNIDEFDLIEAEVTPVRPSRRNKNYTLQKDDSIEELMKAIRAPRPRVNLNTDDDNVSGRTTPEHLKKYAGTAGDEAMDDAESDDNSDEGENKENPGVQGSNMNSRPRRARTYSETLRMLDEDILAELNVQK